MADDLGYSDVGFNGGKQIPTPHIDSIAENGVHFTSGYTSYSVCGPSRAGFITGRYQQRFGFERNPQYRPDDPNMGLPLDERTIADALKPAGYISASIGKWHLGAHPTLHPLNRGVDFFFGHLGGGHHYFPEMLTIKDSYSDLAEEESYNTWILRNHEPVESANYLTDEFSDEAAAFIERNRNQPFFLFLSDNAPHIPMEAPDEYVQRFSQIENEKRLNEWDADLINPRFLGLIHTCASTNPAVLLPDTARRAVLYVYTRSEQLYEWLKRGVSGGPVLAC